MAKKTSSLESAAASNDYAALAAKYKVAIQALRDSQKVFRLLAATANGGAASIDNVLKGLGDPTPITPPTKVPGANTN